MSDTTSNPIVERVTRRWRVISPRTANAIGAAVGLVGFAAVLAATLSPVATALSTLIIGATGVVAILTVVWTPLFGLSIAARLTQRYSSAEEYALLRITTLSAASIFQGYVEASLVYLRLIASLSRWGLLAALPMLAGFIGAGLVGGFCQPALTCLLPGLLPAAAVVGMAVGYVWLMTRALAAVGVWLALRFASWSRLLSGAAVMAGMMGCILLGIDAMVRGIDGLALASVALGSLAASLALGWFARRDALKVIGRAEPSVRAEL